MSGPSSTIVGRDHELHDVSAFLDRVEDGPGALVLEGSRGIGKTTLWLAGVGEAASRGYRVLQSRGAESEARLSYAALGDLLGEAPNALLAGMPTPLRQALDAALFRAEAPGGSVDQRAVSLSAAYALRALATDAPLIVAIDDLQWIDGPSTRVLSFVLRRLADERIGVLASVRHGSGSAGDPVDLDRAMTGTTHLARWPAFHRAARADPSRANESPTPPPRRGPAAPHHRRQPAVRNRDGPGSFRRRPPGRSRQCLGGAGGPAAAPVGETCRVATRGARALARDRRDIPADLGACA